MWQQAGRAGRARQRAAAVLVAARTSWTSGSWPTRARSSSARRARDRQPLEPVRPPPHLACAAYELPLTDADSGYWPDDLDDGVRQLVLDGTLRLRDRRAYYAGGRSPAAGVSLRSGSSEEYQIVDVDNRLIGTIDGSRRSAASTPARCTCIKASTTPCSGWTSTTMSPSSSGGGRRDDPGPFAHDIRFLGEDEHTTVGRVRLSLGPVEVREQVVGYQRKSVYTGEVLGVEDLDLPPTRLVTRGFWYTIGDDVLADARLAPAQVLGTMHAIEHAGIGILPLFTICDRWDVGGCVDGRAPRHRAATIVIYDGYPAGRDRRAGVRRRPPARGGDTRRDHRVSLRRRVPRRACSRPSVGTGMSPSTRTARSPFCEPCWRKGAQGAEPICEVPNSRAGCFGDEGAETKRCGARRGPIRTSPRRGRAAG